MEKPKIRKVNQRLSELIPAISNLLMKIEIVSMANTNEIGIPIMFRKVSTCDQMDEV